MNKISIQFYQHIQKYPYLLSFNNGSYNSDDDNDSDELLEFMEHDNFAFIIGFLTIFDFFFSDSSFFFFRYNINALAASIYE